MLQDFQDFHNFSFSADAYIPCFTKFDKINSVISCNAFNVLFILIVIYASKYNISSIQERCIDVGMTASTLPYPPVPLFPVRAFSHHVVWFFQVVRGLAAKFIQSAKLCSTPCRLPEGSSPTNKRWEPELNAWLRT